MKLYYIPQTSAFRPRWLLEELELSHELVRLTLSAKDTKSPEYLQIHPLGQVPALVDNGLTLIESAAICMYLAEKDPAQRLLPAATPAGRGPYYQWIFYAMDTLSLLIHPVYLRWFLARPEDKLRVATEAEVVALTRALAPVEKALQQSPFLLGERLTTADVVMGGVLQWAEAAGLLGQSLLARQYHDRLAARSAYQRALQ